MPRTRAWVWWQLVIGWLPVWALYTTLIITAHGGASVFHAAFSGLRAVGAAALLGLGVHRLTERVPWPRPFRVSFLLLHVAAALVYAVTWVALVSAMESLLRARFVILAPYGVGPFVILGVWFYVMVAGVAYANRAAERAAEAEAAAVRSQLAALRAQLNPHFLFNALHTVVQLIPRDPRRAAQAAEQVAGLLRTAIEEDRDLVTLAEERSFVERYLELERLRFGDRLDVRLDIPRETDQTLVPSFALQTLVENAVRHGAAPRVEPTTIAISARLRGGALHLDVRDTGAGARGEAPDQGDGTGLRRLRERLAAHFGDAATLDVRPGNAGCTAALVIPQVPDEGDGA